MAKEGGLGDLFFVNGYDLSGDVNSVDQIGGGPNLGDVTGINGSANERIGLQRSGTIQFTNLYNINANAEHAVLSALPLTDVMNCYFHGAAIGNPAACLLGKQLNYDPTRDNTGMLTEKVETDSNGFGLEWAIQHTVGKRSDTTGTTGTAFDASAGATTPSFPATTVPVTNTSPMPVSVVISGGTISNVSVNGVTAGTGDGTYVVPPGGTISVTFTSTAPTWTWTYISAYGAQSYLQVFSFTGTSITIKVRHSADNSTYADLISHTAVTAAPAFERLGVTTNPVNKWTEVVTSGTFSQCTFALGFVRNLTAVSF
jgi:hypothetical protein